MEALSERYAFFPIARPFYYICSVNDANKNSFQL